MFTRSPTAIALVAGLLALSGASALAQTCAAPIVPFANTMHSINTCDGDTSLPLVCGAFPLSGPATIFDLYLPYPAGFITMVPDGNFDPVAFLLQAPCSESAPCYDSADAYSSPIDLSTLDSGHYLLVVTASEFSPMSCGVVSVWFDLTPEQEAGMLDGVFRSGSAPIWQP
jgi:hypothetical protein